MKKPNLFQIYSRIFPDPTSMTTMVRVVMFPRMPDGGMSENGLFLTWKPNDGNWPNFIMSVMTTIGTPRIDYAYAEYLAGKQVLNTFTLKGTKNSPHLKKAIIKDFR